MTSSPTHPSLSFFWPSPTHPSLLFFRLALPTLPEPLPTLSEDFSEDFSEDALHQSEARTLFGKSGSNLAHDVSLMSFLRFF